MRKGGETHPAHPYPDLKIETWTYVDGIACHAYFGLGIAHENEKSDPNDLASVSA